MKQPTKRARLAPPGVINKKTKKRIAAKPGRSPAQRNLVIPLVGGIALIAILALVLAVCRKNKRTGARTTFI